MDNNYLNTAGYRFLYESSMDWNFSEFQVDENIIDSLLDLTDKVLGEKNTDEWWGKYLSGRINGEFLVKHKSIDSGVIDYFHELVKSYVNDNLQITGGEIDWSLFEVHISSQWVNQMFKYEYNPLHIHTQCLFSSVLFLKIPDFKKINNMEFREKVNSDIKDGTLSFIRSSNGPLNNISKSDVVPEVGKFYLFPASLHHMVYPFFSEGERRSMAFNINIIDKEPLGR